MGDGEPEGLIGDGRRQAASRPGTVADEALDETIRDLAPHLALARVDSLGRLIFANVAVIGTLIGGLGLLATTQARPAPTELFGIPLVVALIAVSLVAALIAIAPWLSRINLANRSEVRSAFSTRIKVRGYAAMVAALFFTAAIVAAVAETTRTGVGVSLSGTLSGSGADAKATMSAEATGLTSSARATAKLTELSGGREGAVLCSSEATGDATGKATMSCSVGGVASSTALRAVVSVAQRDDVLTSQRLDMTR